MGRQALCQYPIRNRDGATTSHPHPRCHPPHPLRPAANRRTIANPSPGREQLRVKGFSTLKRWAMDVAKRRGMKRAKVALARKLATVLHRMWVDGTDFRFGKEAAAA